MRDDRTEKLIDEFVRSANDFVSAVNRGLDGQLRRRQRLTPSRPTILRLLTTAGTHNIQQAARFPGVSSAAASKAVDGLVKRRLLQRVESRSDRRNVELSLTETGRQRRASALLGRLSSGIDGRSQRTSSRRVSPRRGGL